jgi:uncharacterized protein (TIGR00288 family)
VSDERLKLAVFIDFDNIQIGVKDTLSKEFDVSLVLEALKERGEVVTKIAYGDWHRAGDQSRDMTQHAVQLVQRNVTPRGDKNGADINLALDALEMAFNRPHINAFAIVGGDSDFITLVEKLKQYDKRVFVVGGRAFTSGILQRNCHEFIAYENLLKAPEPSRPRAARARARAGSDGRSLAVALPNVQRALKILAEREVAPQIGLLKSTLLQLDPTFTERDYGVGSFLEFMQKMERAGYVHLRRTDRGFLVELTEGESAASSPGLVPPTEIAAQGSAEVSPAEAAPVDSEPAGGAVEAVAMLKQALAGSVAKAPHRPLYLRQINQLLRSDGKEFDARRYGFRGILDLLHQAQREGWLRLHRDRKGVWRIFPLAPAAPTGPEAPARLSEATPAESELASPEMDVAWEKIAPPTDEVARETTKVEEAPAAELAAPVAIQEPAPEPAPPARKVRKSRPRRSSKAGPRKALSRRKPKGEPEV